MAALSGELGGTTKFESSQLSGHLASFKDRGKKNLESWKRRRRETD